MVVVVGEGESMSLDSFIFFPPLVVAVDGSLAESSKKKKKKAHLSLLWPPLVAECHFTAITAELNTE